MGYDFEDGCLNCLAAIVTIGCVGIGVATIVFLVAIFSTPPVMPPTMNAPLLEIVRYCEPLSRDKHSSFNGKTTSAWYTDNTDKFLACMQSYEYIVSR